MRMKRQKIKGTGMKLTPNPAQEPNFYSAWPSMPPLGELRVVPPLPPLPEDRPEGGKGKKRGRKGKGASDEGANGNGEGAPTAAMDAVSESMLNALRHQAAFHLPAALQLGMMTPYDMLAMERMRLLSGAGGMGPMGFGGHHPGMGGPGGMGPMGPMGMGQMGGMNMSGHQFPGQHPMGGMGGQGGHFPMGMGQQMGGDSSHSGGIKSEGERSGGGHGGAPPLPPPAAAGLNPSDPIHDELSAMIRSRNEQAQAQQALANGPGPAPPSSIGGPGSGSGGPMPGMNGVDGAASRVGNPAAGDLMLMERLRNLDRAQQLRNMQSHLLGGAAGNKGGQQGGGGGPGQGGPPGGPHGGLPVPQVGPPGLPPGGYGGLGPPMPGGAQENAAASAMASLFPGSSSGGGPHGAPGGHVRHGPGGGNKDAGPHLDQYGPPPGAREGSGGSRPGGGGGPGGPGPNNQSSVESSVSEALREANHLEELALAQRAKARSLALAGALQNGYRPGAAGLMDGPSGGGGGGPGPMQGGLGLGGGGGPPAPGLMGSGKDAPSGPPGGPALGGDEDTWVKSRLSHLGDGLPVPGGKKSDGPSAPSGRPSFGRPFGRKDV